MKKLFIIDDHPIVQQGLSQLLSHETDISVCGHAGSANIALDRVREANPDLVILDLTLGGLNGLDIIKDLRVFLPSVAVLIYSMHDEVVYAERALRAGARGYVMKMEPAEHLLGAIRTVLRGDIHVSEAMVKRSVNRMSGAGGFGGKENRTLVDTLSDRELQVLQHVGHGKSTRTIAQELHISVKTVESHRLHLREKLRLGSAQTLLRFAIEWCRNSSVPA